MSHADIRLVYEGSAVESGVMDVRDLAPALLAFGNLIEATNRVVNGESATAKVQVRTVGAGSFAIGLDVSVAFIQSVRDFLAGPEATAAANLIGVLTGSAVIGAGAIALVKRLRGRGPSAVRRKDGGRVDVEIDGETIEVDEIVARVSVDVSVRAALERVVAEPLSQVLRQRGGLRHPDAPEVLSLEAQRAAAHLDAVRLDEQLRHPGEQQATQHLQVPCLRGEAIH